MIDISEELRKGKQLMNADKFEQAEKIFSQGCAQAPENPDAWFSLGVSRYRLNQSEAAILAFERTIHFDPGNVAAHNAKSNALVDLQRTEEAQDVIKKALKIDPKNSQTLLNYASLLFKGSFYSEALDALNRVFEENPEMPEALEKRAITYTRLGRSEEALADSTRWVKLSPDKNSHLLRASVLIALSRFDEAMITTKHILTLDPENFFALILSAMAMAGLNQYGDAEVYFAQAELQDAVKLGEILAQQDLKLPGEMQFDPLHLYLSLADQRLKACDWHNRSEYLKTLQSYLEKVDRISASDANTMLLKATCQSDIDPQLRLELARQIASKASEGVKKFDYHFLTKPERLRIGYLAKSFNQDSDLLNTAEIYALHNRVEVEVYCYSVVPADNSLFNKRIKKDCDQFTELYPHSEVEAAQKIHDDCIHILIDLDGVGLEYPYKLLAHQCAPVQIGFGGAPYSSGGDFLQYRITHNLISPEGSDHLWAEKLIRLTNTHLFDHSLPVADRREDVKRLERSKMGLPEKGLVYCCFAKAELITPDIFECWMQLLKRIEGSVIWLIEWDQHVSLNLRREAEKFEINPERLVFAPNIIDREMRLSRFQLADLFLDTVKSDAHEITTEALQAGLPVLSLFGKTMESRMTASKLSMLEFPTLICSTKEEYCERAHYLGTHPEYLDILRRKVQRNMLIKPVFNSQLLVLNLEKVYQECWDRYFKGEEIEAFQIEED
ncbi:MAG: tetratricopeptide repeat protein [Gammaproteobacteria bacterium]